MMKDWILDVSGDLPGNVFLIRGSKNFIFDADMAYCGERLADRIEQAVSGGKLDGVFLTHSHYDHISGIPMLRKRWPSLIVYAAPYAAGVLKKESALNMIRQMNQSAAEDRRAVGRFTDDGSCEYSDESLQVDRELDDGETVEMGEYSVTAYATPGHTRDCLSYRIRKKGEQESLLLCSETTGAPADGTFIPASLVSFEDSVRSIDKLEALKPGGLLFSHWGYMKMYDGVWDDMRRAYNLARIRYLEELQSGKSEADMIHDLESYYWTKSIRKYQPYRAYEENTKYMLRVIKREFCQGDEQR